MKTKRAREAAGPVAPTVALTAQQALWLELMQFYIREAWLLDERKLKEWLQLFTDDVLYFMPRRKNVPRRELHRELTPPAIWQSSRRTSAIWKCGWPGSTAGWPGPRIRRRAPVT